ncbi:hypothetical protein [Burkholderia sp. Ac-20365]|uniref:hypothetical protein n=1 Tax=Burkholderia sp. Ac-20365 TaxID=2703897 RepID=UPI00197C1CA2|nr:hypothetical protein [Burkholderia sp. Ac-20365]MBN3759205.1 hypothetical protein [Burkholderia sp. Ac-20365]
MRNIGLANDRLADTWSGADRSHTAIEGICGTTDIPTSAGTSMAERESIPPDTLIPLEPARNKKRRVRNPHLITGDFLSSTVFGLALGKKRYASIDYGL